MHWVSKDELSDVPLVDVFRELLQVMLDDRLTEFQYIIQDDNWNVIIK